jgi:predicted phage terminase large subunit-like protein
MSADPIASFMSEKEYIDLQSEILLAEAFERKNHHPAQASMAEFTQHTMPEYDMNWHHELICEKLDSFISGDIKRLMVFAPPRHGKSELVSRRLPAKILGDRPNAGIIATSYGADLARRMNRDVQRIIDNELYQEVYPNTQLYGKNIRSTAQHSWLRNSDIFEVVDHSGFYIGTGVLGSITGTGFDYGILDDPYKNRQDANSATIRQGVWDWYRSTFRTRAAPNAGIAIILTRWHEIDLAAQLLELADAIPDADQWEVVSLPAVSDGMGTDGDTRQDGEPLWPNRFDMKSLNATRATLGSYEWSALYQQNPTPAEGTFFKRSWFEIVNALPDGCTFVRWWDKAATAGAGDYTAGVLMARSGGKFYIVDVVRGQWSSGERDMIIKQTAAIDKQIYGYLPQWTEQEPGSSGKDAAIAFVNMLSGYTAKFETSTGSKEQRADPFRSQAEIGNIYLLSANWNHVFLDELTAFPHGSHDDQVDSASSSFGKLSVSQGIQFGKNPMAGYRG